MVGIRPTGDEREAAIRQYLRAVGHPVPLEGAEELDAAATVADGRAAENDLAALTGAPMLDLDHLAALRDRIRAGEDARARLMAGSRQVVVALARRHPADGPRTEALLAAGEDALARAVDRYDPTGGLAFSAFARWWVERAMREVERHPVGHVAGSDGPVPADPTLLTALGHLHEEDCRIIELRLGLAGAPPMSAPDTARVLGLGPGDAGEREEKALAKLRHPSTPGDLTHLRRL